MSVPVSIQGPVHTQNGHSGHLVRILGTRALGGLEFTS